MENLSLDQILEQMNEIIDEARNLPLSKNIILNKEVMLGYLEELTLKLPEEIKHAKYVSDQKQKILTEAKREADQITKNAENLIARKINEHEITKDAYKEAERIMAEAKQTARDIRNGSLQYADELLEGLEREFFERLQELRQNRKDLKRG